MWRKSGLAHGNEYLDFFFQFLCPIIQKTWAFLLIYFFCWANYLTSFSNNGIYPIVPESWTFYSSTEVLPRALFGFCLVRATSPIFSKSFQWVFQNLILSTWDIPWSFKGNFCANTIAENCLTGRVWGLFVCGKQ